MSNATKRGSHASQEAGNIVTLTDAKPKQEREKGRINAIVESIKNEQGFFYLSDYVAKFPPATVQGMFSVLKAYGVIVSVAGSIEDANGNRRVERGKYIRKEVLENVELQQANERIAQLEAELAALRSAK